MKKLMLSLRFLLVAALITPPNLLAQSKNTMEVHMEQVEKFIADFNKSAYLPLLAGEELTKLLASSHVDFTKFSMEKIMKAQVDRVSEVYGGPEQPDKRLEWSEQQAEWQRRAYDIAKGIVGQSIEEMNLALLALLHRYLMDDSARPALSYVFEGLYSVRFSQAEQYRIRKEAHWMTQAGQGSLWGIIGGSIVLMLSGKRLPSAWKSLTEALFQTSKGVSKKVVVETSEHGMTGDEMLAMIRRSGLASTKTQAPRVASTAQVVSQVSKFRVFSKMSNVFSRDGFKSYLKLSAAFGGIAVAGAGANVGLHAIYNWYSGESISAKDIEFLDLRENYYDGLAALRLACASHDYLQRLQDGEHLILSAEDLRNQVKEMNGLYTEFDLLKRINMTLIDVTPLSSDIKVDSETGKVTFKTNVRGKAVDEQFECSKLKGHTGGPISVSLNEVLVDVVEAGKHLTSLIENEKELKKDQDKRDVVPGAPR